MTLVYWVCTGALLLPGVFITDWSTGLESSSIRGGLPMNRCTFMTLPLEDCIWYVPSSARLAPCQPINPECKAKHSQFHLPTTHLPALILITMLFRNWHTLVINYNKRCLLTKSTDWALVTSMLLAAGFTVTSLMSTICSSWIWQHKSRKLV